MSETTNLATIIKGVKITRTAKVSPDKDSDKSKVINLVIDFDGVALSSVVAGAVRSDVIRWQASARKKFDKLADGSTIEVKYQAPPVEDVQASTIAFLSTMTPAEREAWIKKNLK